MILAQVVIERHSAHVVNLSGLPAENVVALRRDGGHPLPYHCAALPRNERHGAHSGCTLAVQNKNQTHTRAHTSQSTETKLDCTTWFVGEHFGRFVGTPTHVTYRKCSYDHMVWRHRLIQRPSAVWCPVRGWGCDHVLHSPQGACSPNCSPNQVMRGTPHPVSSHCFLFSSREPAFTWWLIVLPLIIELTAPTSWDVNEGTWSWKSSTDWPQAVLEITSKHSCFNLEKFRECIRV